MSINKSKKFIEFLDSYSKKSEYNYIHYASLTSNIAKDYEINYLNNKDINDYYINNSYLEWQHKHLTDIKIKQNKKTSKNKNKIIDTDIKNLNDLVVLIDENEYNEDTDYNIDLKLLHDIKNELKDLNNMVGLEQLKESVLDQLFYFIQNLHIGENNSDYKHTVLFGPPGTGKTEIAKIIGKLYSKIGVLKTSIFRKVTRNDLIAGYLGQTAIKTKKVISECIGGVLFIDEAYSLIHKDQNDSFSKECIDVLCEALSDHKHDLMVIIAGYEKELENTFFKANQGLESRFIWRFHLDSYNAEELFQIFEKKVLEQGWKIQENALSKEWFEKHKDDFKHFGRDVEILLTNIKICHGRRIYGKEDTKKEINLQDIDKGFSCFKKNKTKKEESVLYSMYI